MPTKVQWFEFVEVSDPGTKAPDAVWRQQVKSHTGRNPRARRQRVIDYQSSLADHRRTANGVKEADDEPSRNKRMTEASAAGHLSPQPWTPLSAARRDPFSSFSRPVTLFESFLLDHFVHFVIKAGLTCLPFANPADEKVFRHGMNTQWIQIAAADTGMMAGVFLVSCRNLWTLHHDRVYETMALQYKSESIHLLSLALRAEGKSISNATITKTLALASDAMKSSTGDWDASVRHFNAAREMVSLRGGIVESDFLARLVDWSVGNVPCEGQSRVLEPFYNSVESQDSQRAFWACLQP